MDAYNFSFMLMNLWRNKAMSNSGVPGKLAEVPVYIQLNNELKKIVDIKEVDGKIILVKESCAEEHT
jgi:hypothetical protein